MTVQGLLLAALHAWGVSAPCWLMKSVSFRSWQLPVGSSPQSPMVGSKAPPLAKQSIAEMHSPTSAALLMHASLHAAKRSPRLPLPPQSGPHSLMTQLSAKPVSWRTSWSFDSPRGEMHIASRTELALPTEFAVAVVMTSPQTSRQPPAALMTCWLTAPCVFQKPGVRQMAGWQDGSELSGVC